MKIYNVTQTTGVTTDTALGTPMSLATIFGFSVQSSWTVSTFSAQVVASAAIDFATATWTKASHGLVTGLKVQVSTSSALPAGLLAVTDYFVIAVSASTFMLASSLALAQAGTAVTLTDAGVGNQTVTPTALAGAGVKLQATNYDALDSNVTPAWTDLADPQTVTATGSFLWNIPDANYKFFRIRSTLTAGAISVTSVINSKGF